MRQLISITFLFLLLTSGKKPEVKLGTVSLFNKQVGINVPSSFTNLPETEFKKYYTTESLPKIVFVNDLRDVRISFSAISLSSKESGIPILTAKFELGLKKIHPKAKWLDKGVEIIDGNKVGFIEYINKKPEKFYELLFFTSFKGQLLSCTFHAPKKGHKPWKQIAHEMMNSLTIKK